jgi:hypothetical protein
MLVAIIAIANFRMGVVPFDRSDENGSNSAIGPMPILAANMRPARGTGSEVQRHQPFMEMNIG